MPYLSRYSVILHKTSNFKEFDDKMGKTTTKEEDSFIPTRIVNKCSICCLPLSDRQDVYFLSIEEANILKNHPNVNIITPHIDSLQLLTSGAMQTNTVFSSAPSYQDTSKSINTGLFIHTDSSSYSTSDVGGILLDVRTDAENTPSSKDYKYVLDGTGVDIVLVDSGFNMFHEDFLNSNQTKNRVNPIDWPQYLSIDVSTPNINFYPGWYGNISSTSNLGSHGNIVMSQAAGRIHGWAKNSELYFMRLGNYPTVGSFGASAENCALMIKRFHESKSIDTNLGYKRPTICLMSYGYNARANYFTLQGSSETRINKVFYSGSLVYSGSNGLSTSISGSSVGVVSLSNIPYQVPSIDSAFEEMCDSGVIFIHSAMNQYTPMWASGSNSDPDFDPFNVGWYDDKWYNSYFSYNTASVFGPADTPIYYLRPSSPCPPAAINIGALNSSNYWGNNVGGNDSSYPQFAKAPYSNAGPRVDFYLTNGLYGAGNSYDSDFFDGNIYPNGVKTQYRALGTSFAAPQMAGMCALFLQMNPKATSLDIKKYFKSVSLNINTGSRSPGTWGIAPSSGDYPSVYGSLQQSVPIFPFASPSIVKLTNIKLGNFYHK